MNKITVAVLIGIIGLTGYAQKTTASKGLFSSPVDTSSFSIKKHKPLASKKQNLKPFSLAFPESIALYNNTPSCFMPIIEPKGKHTIPNYFEETEDKRSLIIFDAK